jgi:hypothetical protein
MHAPTVERHIGPASDAPDIVELMVEWFFRNFDDPSVNTPCDSESGYMFIWGGPYDAREELEDAFGDVVTEKAIEKAVDEIQQSGWEWAPNDNRMVAEMSDQYALDLNAYPTRGPTS